MTDLTEFICPNCGITEETRAEEIWHDGCEKNFSYRMIPVEEYYDKDGEE